MRRASIALCLTVYALPLAGQTRTVSADSSANPCVVLNGIRLGADWGDSGAAGARSDTSRRGSFRLGGGATIDTTLTFDVTDRTWSRQSLMAYVAGGVSGHTRSATSSMDPRSSWHACVGIILGMQQPTLVMRGVHGQMHLKIDLTPLTRIPGATLDSSRQNQSRR
jgi:hypothetical protein